MATAARCTIAEVEHLVHPGELEPDLVHTPGVFVQKIIHGREYSRQIEKRTVRRG
jgi:3-oxoacid CoA-transferase subunit A